MGRREPCICCGQDPIEADLGNLCHACFEHFPRGHPAQVITDREGGGERRSE